MTFMKTFLISTSLISIPLLSTWISSSDNDEEVFADPYLQFYNGSANSAATLIAEIDGNTLGTEIYGDVSGLIISDSGEIELELFRIDADDQHVTLEEVTVDLLNGEKMLIILSGDYESPTFTAYRYMRE